MHFKSKNLKGLYSDNIIAISKNIETQNEKTCVLAEEIGHHFTTHGEILNLSDIAKLKQENKARNWAYEKLVRISDIINAFEYGARNRYELSEYLEVTEVFIAEAIDYYRKKYGLCYSIDKYVVYFEPNLAVLKLF